MAADELKKNVEEMITGGFVALAFSIGFQKGIFNFMAEHDDSPMTSAAIAQAVGMKERYIREWLSCMAASKIVDLDASGTRFTFPKDRLASLTDLASASIFLACCGEAYMRVTDCFPTDGPLGLSHLENKLYYDAVEKEGETFCNWKNIKLWISHVPNLIKKLETGMSVLEVGCGRGRFSCLIAEKFPKSNFYGVDLAGKELENAKTRAKGSNLTNVTFEKRSLYDLPLDWDNKWESILIYDVIHDLSEVDKGLAAIYRVLRPGGTALIVDMAGHSALKDNMGDPLAATNYSISLFVCMTDSLSSPGGEGAGIMMGEEVMESRLHKAGFNVTIGRMPDGEQNILYVCTK